MCGVRLSDAPGSGIGAGKPRFYQRDDLSGQGRAGGGAARLGQINLPSRLGTFYCGFAIYNPTNVTVDFNDTTKSTNFSLKFTSAGAVIFTPQSASNAVSSAPMAVIPGSVWQYIEVYGVISPTGGACTVRVNETVVLSAVSANTASGSTTLSTGVDQIDFGSFGTDLVDDFYICDNTGASLNNFLGNVRVPAQTPNGVGASTQWTPTGSASFNWQLASNPYMDDSSYVACATPGDIDLYTYRRWLMRHKFSRCKASLSPVRIIPASARSNP